MFLFGKYKNLIKTCEIFSKLLASKLYIQFGNKKKQKTTINKKNFKMSNEKNIRQSMMVTILENKMDIHAVERHMDAQREQNQRMVTEYEDRFLYQNRRDNKLKPGVQKKTYVDNYSFIGFLLN